MSLVSLVNTQASSKNITAAWQKTHEKAWLNICIQDNVIWKERQHTAMRKELSDVYRL